MWSQLLSLFVISLLISCSSGHYQAESLKAKMARYKSQREKTQSPPKFIVPKNEWVARGRGIASINKPQAKVKYSHRQVYFLSLFDQYKRLNAYTSKSTRSIRYCPSFHSAIVRSIGYDNSYRYKLPASRAPQTQAETLWRPELMLPVSYENDGPTLYSITKNQNSENYNKVLKTALTYHTQRTFLEIKELCQHGNSDNYYVFANLIKLRSDSKANRADKTDLEALLKTTVFANTAILTSLGQKKTNGPFLHSEVLQRLKADWSTRYFAKLNHSKE